MHQQFPTRHGQSFHLLVFRQNLPHGWLPPLAPVVPGADGLGLIQTRAHIARTAPERLTHGLVAHDHGPGDREVLKLDTLIPIAVDTCAVQLITGHHDLQVPSYVEIDSPATSAKVEKELSHWGLTCTVIQFGNRDKFLCLNRQEDGFHYVLCNEDFEDDQGCILHTQDRQLDHIDLMRLLENLGYNRAVILEVEEVGLGHTRVLFCNNDPQFAKHVKLPKIRSEWPEWQVDTAPINKLFPAQDCREQGARHCVETAFTNSDLQELLAAGKNFLNTNFEGLELPDFVQAALNQPRSQSRYDRWLIYTDGSSQSKLRRMAPQQADELGHPDSWAMLVLGESQMPDGTTVVEPIGWCAHPVHYDSTGACYTHAMRIGAEVAEREAMIWAGLWRLSQDSNIPTIFCCDSLTCGNQAFGNMGVGTADESYRLMRGIFQSLEHGLPVGHLRLHHVRSHAGDPYNEFVDWAAKQEAVKSFNHSQMRLDMNKWSQILPHLWLVFGHHCGLPPWKDGQLVTSRPSLPKDRAGQDSSATRTCTEAIQCTLSIATANVLSLSRSPEGQRGKLHYLFEQMKHFGLNIMGLQECRSDEGHTKSNNILRYMSGQRQGQEGVEVWINLDQPIAHTEAGKPCFLAAQHCQIAYKDPRRLLLRITSPFLDGWFFVAHAPHSGRPREEQETWWTETAEILSGNGATKNCFWMLDANAEPGPGDDLTVFCKGLRTSTNTIYFRECLQQLGMCLPSTSSVHRGCRDTWTRPDGDATFCIDYVAVSQEWKMHCTWSEVLSDFDLATTRCDHQAVGLELRWCQLCESRPKQKPNHTVSWHQESTQRQVRAHMKKVQVPDWTTDVETQEASLSTQIDSILSSQRSGKNKPKKCYIDEEIWEARNLMLSLQKRLKQVRNRIGRESLWIVFNAWRTSSQPRLIHEHFHYGTTLRCDALLLLAKFRDQRCKVRRKLKCAKVKHMEQCLEKVTEHTAASSILRILRGFIGPTNPKKQKKGTLPMLEKDDGTICTTSEEALQVWIKFFAEMEGGKRQSMEELHADWLNDLRYEPIEPFQISVKELPTLADLELAYRRVAVGKATGPDRVNYVIWHLQPVHELRTPHFGNSCCLAMKHYGTKVDCLYKRTKARVRPLHAALTVHC